MSSSSSSSSSAAAAAAGPGSRRRSASIGSTHQTETLPDFLSRSWHRSFSDVPIEDKIRTADRMIQRLMGWDPSENPLIEFLYDPKTGNLTKAVLDVEAFHRRQAAAFQGILGVLGDIADPSEVEKLLRMDVNVEPTRPAGLREKNEATIPNGVQPPEDHSVAKLAIEGARLSVPSSKIPFLVGSDSEECHFDISSLMDFSDQRGPTGEPIVHAVHCAIDRNTNGGWILRNYGGGTFVDGTPVPRDAIAPLRPGSQIQIHYLTFIFFPIES
ncbi:hypothetical protein Pmar_PMAR003933 [Perkinsus marinus ATCC 50983]|uniref:FHA domain-containing protein n=1 Tax=Perkinsus marinus (strain ATCC 50983 / TXsc) TaxID=423536 RepID=C5L853_PERM5|nr:hypothetical protein Pmar_PMAR003933 [Perkinsus marinus ATCC 50983]EER07079.1 hypothetical protein Pmar_PMAR003933 [Perkinsus marinus ATCC 50983]|eukprot:XP_002775263.1 hypothetical protein Pmar_PMAR003933 [Perkinsus marinus ATCC 50983]